MAKKRKKGIIITVCAVAAVVLAGAIGLRAVGRRTAYTTVKAGKSDISTYYSFSGSVDAKNRQTVYADQAMQIRTLDVAEGQKVAKNDVLFKASDGTQVEAPISGTVTSLNVAENQLVSPGAVLLQIADYSVMQLNVKVDEYDLSAVTVGKAADVTVHALGRSLRGTVASVAQEGTDAGGVTYFDATVSLPADGMLRAGMSAEARVLSQSVRDVVTLPVADLHFHSDNTPYVQVPDAQKRGTREVKVTVGLSDGTTAEIKSGLDAGQQVVVPSSVSDSSNFFMQRRTARADAGSGVSGSTVSAGGTVSQ